MFPHCSFLVCLLNRLLAVEELGSDTRTDSRICVCGKWRTLEQIPFAVILHQLIPANDEAWHTYLWSFAHADESTYGETDIHFESPPRNLKHLNSSEVLIP